MLGPILRSHMKFLQSCLDFHLKAIWNPFWLTPLHLSLLIEAWNMAFTGSFCSNPLCSILLSPSAPSTRPWCASGSSFLPEGVRNCREYIFSLWVWRVTVCSSSCGNAQNRSWIWLEVNLDSWMLKAIEVHLGGKAWEVEQRVKILKEEEIADN